MKKQHHTWKLAVGAVILALPLFASAETAVEVGASANIGASVDAGPADASMNVRATLKQRLEQSYQERAENIRNNEDYRNIIMQKRAGTASTTKASTTPARMSERAEVRDDRRDDVKDTRDDKREDMKNASSSVERREIRIENEIKIFMIRQTAFVRQLQISLANLTQIRGRIAARISTEAQNGRDLAEAKTLLDLADQKLSLANDAVKALAAYVPATTTASTTASASASTTLDLGKPRQIGSAAIQAVNAARKALNDVVVAIAHSMGLKVGIEGRIQATSTASTTAQ